MDELTLAEINDRLRRGLPPSRLRALVVCVRWALRSWNV